MINNNAQARYQAIRNVTVLGLVANIILAVGKVLFGFIGHSQALVADGLHSLSDLISDAVVLVAARYAVADADDAHPYGHQRYETVATVAVGGLLIFVAIGVFSDAVYRLVQSDTLLIPSMLSLIVAFASIVVKEGLYQYTFYVAQQVSSPMLRANAWHHRSDALSSIVVLVGITGALFGFAWFDAVAALLVSVMIFHIGWELSTDGLKQLVDTGVNAEIAEKITHIITRVEGVRTIHMLRTRYMGESILIDVHILVDSRITVSEGHYIGDRVHFALCDAMPEIADITLHIDPENDEKGNKSIACLSPRSSVFEQLQQAWQPLLASHNVYLRNDNIGLHYLSGKIIVDVYLPLKVLNRLDDVAQLEQQLQTLGVALAEIKKVRVYYQNQSMADDTTSSFGGGTQPSLQH